MAGMWKWQFYPAPLACCRMSRVTAPWTSRPITLFAEKSSKVVSLPDYQTLSGSDTHSSLVPQEAGMGLLVMTAVWQYLSVSPHAGQSTRWGKLGCWLTPAPADDSCGVCLKCNNFEWGETSSGPSSNCPLLHYGGTEWAVGESFLRDGAHAQLWAAPRLKTPLTPTGSFCLCWHCSQSDTSLNAKPESSSLQRKPVAESFLLRNQCSPSSRNTLGCVFGSCLHSVMALKGSPSLFFWGSVFMPLVAHIFLSPHNVHAHNFCCCFSFLLWVLLVPPLTAVSFWSTNEDIRLMS